MAVQFHLQRSFGQLLDQGRESAVSTGWILAFMKRLEGFVDVTVGFFDVLMCHARRHAIGVTQNSEHNPTP